MGQVADRWVRTKSDEVAIDRGCWFDQAAVDRVRYFFERFLRHSKGSDFAGKPFVLLDWQYDRVIAPAFGWKMPDGTRRFRRVGVAIPKKNGKSTLLSGVGLFMLMGDGEPGAEVYSAAADRDQASIIYEEAANMVDASPALLRRIRVLRSKKLLVHGASRSLYKALSADVPTKEGLNIHCLLFDELHAQKTRDLWNTLRYGFASRKQPMLWWISTAGVDQESVCYEQWQRAKAVQESREIDISLLPYICEASDEDDWKSEDVWRRVNPSYGQTISTRDMREGCDEAVALPANENNFKRYRLNIWTRQTVRWIPTDRWRALARKIDWSKMRRQPCRLGLDLAATTDIAAASLLFPRQRGYRLLTRFWVPAAALVARVRENKTRLDEWVRRGFVKVTDGDVLDYDVIRKDINDMADEFKVMDVSIDPWNATQLAVQLAGDGLDVQFVRTGFLSISAASKEFEKLILGGMIEHDGNPVMDWMIGNVAKEDDASGNIKPSKRRSAEKIDGVVSTIIALARHIAAVPQRPSKYETQGLTVLEAK